MEKKEENVEEKLKDMLKSMKEKENELQTEIMELQESWRQEKFRVDERVTEEKEQTILNGKYEKLINNLEQLLEQLLEEARKELVEKIKNYHLDMTIKASKKKKELEGYKIKENIAMNYWKKNKEALENKRKNLEEFLAKGYYKDEEDRDKIEKSLKETKDEIIKQETLRIKLDSEVEKTVLNLESEYKKFLEQKERAGALIAGRMSEMSINEIEDILFGNGLKKREEIKVDMTPKTSEKQEEIEAEPVPKKMEKQEETEIKTEEPKQEARPIVTEVKNSLRAKILKEQNKVGAEQPTPSKKEGTTELDSETIEQEVITRKEPARQTSQPKSHEKTVLEETNADLESFEHENTIEEEEREKSVEEGRKAPIDKIAISITKSGSIVEITRNGKKEWKTAIIPLDKVRLKNIETEGRITEKQAYLNYIINSEIDANILEEAKEIGDEFVIREILLKLDNPEREEQLGKYIATLKGEYTEDLPFKLNYYLKDIRKSGLSKEDRKALLDNAKKVRDLNKTIEQETGLENALGEVQVPILTKAKWLWQDSKIGKWFSRNLLPKGRNDEQHQTEKAEEAIEQEETVQEEKRYTRVAGVERVEVDVADALSRAFDEDEAPYTEKEAAQTENEEDYIDLPF